MLNRIRGQSILEYTVLISIVTAVVMILFPMIKRANQSLIKTVADEVGQQRRAEQDYSDPSGYMISSKTISSGQTDDITYQNGYGGATPRFVSNKVYDDVMVTNSNVYSNAGFTEFYYNSN